LEKIILNIDQAGNVTVETKGVKGKGCLDVSKFIEEALGNVAELKKTSEYYADVLEERVRVSTNGGR
jgi:hypothetical protein